MSHHVVHCDTVFILLFAYVQTDLTLALHLFCSYHSKTTVIYVLIKNALCKWLIVPGNTSICEMSPKHELASWTEIKEQYRWKGTLYLGIWGLVWGCDILWIYAWWDGWHNQGQFSKHITATILAFSNFWILILNKQSNCQKCVFISFSITSSTCIQKSFVFFPSWIFFF